MGATWPKGTKPANLFGVKGKSGRKCYRDEQLRMRVIQKAWEKKDKRMTEQDATQIVIKDMTNKIEHGGILRIDQITGTKVIKDNGNNFQDPNSTANPSY
jgi:hypothetical protein